ncbi:hypothetical protein KI387_036318, partial [Taxus chinensis]
RSKPKTRSTMADVQNRGGRGGILPLPPPLPLPLPPPPPPPLPAAHAHTHAHHPQPRGPPGPSRPPILVDREKTCPLLLRVFTKIGNHHTTEDFAVRGKEPKDEVQIYTWRDATLRELTDLVKEVAPAARRRDAKLSFAFVYPDRRGRNVVRQVGVTYAYPNARRPDEGNKALADLSFQ